tara:strand:- start:764 stop:1342 length:579 start_codon:yes stop_codon:yes gene_type:complete
MSDSSEEENVMENMEITNPEPAVVETITRPKKPRTEKQKAALEKARLKRAEKIAEKKKIKEYENKLIEDNKDMLKEMALNEVGNIEAVIEDEPEPLELPPPIIKKPKKEKKKKVKKVVVNNYYEPEDSSSDEELIEEQNNFYSNNKKKGRKVSIAPNPNTQEYLNDENVEYEEEVVATNHYTFNPYGNIRFC